MTFLNHKLKTLGDTQEGFQQLKPQPGHFAPSDIFRWLKTDQTFKPQYKWKIQ